MKLGASDYLVKGLDLVDRLPGVFGRLFRELDTERRLHAAEKALRKSEEYYRVIAEDTPMLICRFLPSGWPGAWPTISTTSCKRFWATATWRWTRPERAVPCARPLRRY